MLTESRAEVVRGELVQIVDQVFATMLGLQIEECGVPWFPGEDRLTSTVHMAGDWNARVQVECDSRQACRFAGCFLSMDPPEEADDVVRDVLGELANMIGGNLKCLLVNGMQLSPPSVTGAITDALPECDAHVRERIALRCEDGLIWLTVLATGNTAALKT